MVIMHPDGMAVVLEIPQFRSIVHSFEQAQVGDAHLANKMANVRGDPWPAAAPS